jgi:hypothetical protein
LGLVTNQKADQQWLSSEWKEFMDGLRVTWGEPLEVKAKPTKQIVEEEKKSEVKESKVSDDGAD